MTAKTREHIRFEVIDGVGRITFDLPQFSNALDLQGIQETLAAFHEAEDRSDVGAVMLTGAGSTFCAGFNLKEIPVPGSSAGVIKDHFRELAMWWHQLLHKIVRIPKPVLAAVNGVAAGSGLGMTLCSDLAVCSRSARFLCAWHTIGLANDATTSYSLVKIVGFRRAMELMMTNRTLDADEALEWQLVNRVYDDAVFGDTALQIARELAAGPTHLQAMAKESFHMGWLRSIEEATEFEIQNVMRSLADPYFEDSFARFISAERKSNIEQVTLP